MNRVKEYARSQMVRLETYSGVPDRGVPNSFVVLAVFAYLGILTGIDHL